MFTIDSNIHRKDRFDVIVGVGIYLTGKALNKNGDLIDKNIAKEKAKLKDVLQFINSEMKGLGKSSALFVLDDASPAKVDLSGIFEKTAVITLTKNWGIGQKENILEVCSRQYSPFLFRFDQDVKIQGPLSHMFAAHEEIENLFGAGINSGFIGAMLTGGNENDDPYIHTVQLANGILERTEFFDVIGHTDPQLRYFHDLDLFYRAKEAGFKTVMAMKAKGSAVASRAAGTTKNDYLKFEAQYLKATNHCLDFYLRKNGLPCIRYKPTKKSELPLYPPKKVAPSPLSLFIRDSLGL